MDAAIARYPQEHRRSAAMPLLHLWQEHFGFISDDAVTWIAAKLGVQPINILELVTFYPMFRQEPAGKTHIRVCRTLSCAMAGGFWRVTLIARIEKAPAEPEPSSRLKCYDQWNGFSFTVSRTRTRSSVALTRRQFMPGGHATFPSSDEVSS